MEKKFAPVLETARDQIIRDFDNRFVVDEEIKTEDNEEAVAILRQACESILESVDDLNGRLERWDVYEAGGEIGDED